jgi:hypothetical protein
MAIYGSSDSMSDELDVNGQTVCMSRAPSFSRPFCCDCDTGTEVGSSGEDDDGEEDDDEEDEELLKSKLRAPSLVLICSSDPNSTWCSVARCYARS